MPRTLDDAARDVRHAVRTLSQIPRVLSPWRAGRSRSASAPPSPCSPSSTPSCCARCRCAIRAGSSERQRAGACLPQHSRRTFPRYRALAVIAALCRESRRSSRVSSRSAMGCGPSRYRARASPAHFSTSSVSHRRPAAPSCQSKIPIRAHPVAVISAAFLDSAILRQVTRIGRRSASKGDRPPSSACFPPTSASPFSSQEPQISSPTWRCPA